jgi:hypothetical protein
VLSAQGGAVPLCATRGVGTSGAGGKTSGSPSLTPLTSATSPLRRGGRGSPPAGHTKDRHAGGGDPGSFPQADCSLAEAFCAPDRQGNRSPAQAARRAGPSGVRVKRPGQSPLWPSQPRSEGPEWASLPPQPGNGRDAGGCEMTWVRFSGQTPRRGCFALGVTHLRGPFRATVGGKPVSYTSGVFGRCLRASRSTEGVR